MLMYWWFPMFLMLSTFFAERRFMKHHLRRKREARTSMEIVRDENGRFESVHVTLANSRENEIKIERRKSHNKAADHSEERWDACLHIKLFNNDPFQESRTTLNIFLKFLVRHEWCIHATSHIYAEEKSISVISCRTQENFHRETTREEIFLYYQIETDS